jgi:hypothetical protein
MAVTIGEQRMKRTLSAVAAIAMSMAFSASAAGVGQDKIPQLQQPGIVDAKSVTLNGCVARGTATDSYTLTEKKDATAPAATDAAPVVPVKLAGTDVDMSKHVGHSVSVTGSYAPAAVATATPTGTAGTEKPAPAPTVAPEGDTKAARTFTVKSLKMVASTC